MDIKHKHEVAALGFSRHAQKRVLAALNGWHGERILGAFGGDVAAAAKALERARAASGGAHRANLAIKITKQENERPEINIESGIDL